MNHHFSQPSVAPGVPHATELNGLVALATHHPVDAAGRPVGVSRRADHSAFIDVVTQTRAAMQRLLETVEGLGLVPGDLLSITVYLRHHGEIPMVDAALTSLLPEGAAPVRHHLCVSDLAHRHYLVAVAGQAVRRAPSTSAAS